MPKIEVDKRSLFAILGRRFTREEFAELLSAAKAELDEWIEAEGSLKIELNDTNRPDLWSGMGLARQLRVYLGAESPVYPFMSTPERALDTGDHAVIVEEGLKRIRPYIAAFVAKGIPISEALLKELIQTQEKLCWNYGRKRSSIAMGVYRGDLMTFPVRFRAADPDRTSFVPLDFDRPMTLRQILERHPKGVEFASIIAHFPRFPYLEDARGETLSMPPIINSAHLGAVKVGDATHFIEMTGTDLASLLTACSIVACDLADAGYTILPVRVAYPYDTPYGRDITTPFYFQKPVSLEVEEASRLLGETIGAEEAEACIHRMGVPVRRSGERLTANPPPYRNDFLHPVDLVEEIMIGRGMQSFEPIWPEEFTVGRLSEIERASRRVRELLVGMGWQEMIYNYLGSRQDFVERMNGDGARIVEIANPMSESYELVRDSPLPSLLGSEAVSANAAYPHRIFEIGKAVVLDERENYGSRTITCLGMLWADREAGFTDLNAHLAALLYYLGREYRLEEAEDSRFVPGRTGAILVKGKRIGLMGEVHPEILDHWGIQMPCAALELELDSLMER